MNQPIVSVVINTYNRAQLLAKTLAALRFLDYSPIEVVVVNGPSKDNTREVIAKFGQEIKYGDCPVANLSISRNIGIAMAVGHFIAFIDDDAVPEPEWLDQIVAGFDSDQVGACGGKVFDHTGYAYQYEYANCNRLGNGKWQLKSPSPQYCFPFSDEFPYLQGTNIAFRRSAILEIGGFDEAFAYYLDETEVCLRLIDRGYLINQLPSAYVHHKYAPSHIRDKGVAKYRFPVIKSKVYFAFRHATQNRKLSEIKEDAERFVQAQRADVRANIHAGRLPPSALPEFEEQAREAFRQGVLEAGDPAKLLSEATLQRFHSPFTSFGTAQGRERSLVIVLMCEDYPPNLVGGIGRFTEILAKALTEIGQKVHVICRAYEGHSTVDLEDGVWVHRLAVGDHAYTAEAECLKVPKHHWNQSRTFELELDRIATHRPVDIVQSSVWNIVSIAALLSMRYRVVTCLHTTMKLTLSMRSQTDQVDETVAGIIRMEKYLIDHSWHLLACTNGIAEEVEKAYSVNLRDGRCVFIQHGMPDLALGVKDDVSATETVHVLYVGRLEKRKGIDVLLEAAKSILKIRDNVVFHIVGDTSICFEDGLTAKERFERSDHEIVANGKLIFYGKIPDSQLMRLYKQCTLFVAPSRFESFGLMYVEAMTFGKPVIGCDAGGVRDVVRHGRNGLLCKPGDAASLQEALISLIDDPAMRSVLGKAGREIYDTVFSARLMAESSVKFYKSITYPEAITQQ